MCVIIHKPAGLVIPPEKIESAWENNKDGVGFTFDDRGEFNIRKWLSKDPDEINKVIEDLKDVDAMIHLRFKTKGKVDRTNLHPFTTCSVKKNGVNLQFYHNGTLPQFGDSTQSDTNAFNAEIMQPLYSMLAQKYDRDVNAILDDEFGHKVVEEFRSAGSVFCLYGDNGQWLKWGSGVEHDGGWWSSNDHYFDTYKRSSYQQPDTMRTYYRGYGSNREDQPNFTDTGSTTKTSQSGSKQTTSSTSGTSSNTDTVKKLGDNPKTDDILTLLGIDELSDLCHYTRDAYERLITNYPYEASLIILALVQELYWSDVEGEEK